MNIEYILMEKELERCKKLIVKKNEEIINLQSSCTSLKKDLIYYLEREKKTINERKKERTEISFIKDEEKIVNIKNEILYKLVWEE